MKWFFVISSCFVLILSACDVHSPQSIVGIQQDLAPVPDPSRANDLDVLLNRHQGQGRFLTLQSSFWLDGVRGSEKRTLEGEDSDRDEQEADVFKLGRPGSKLLYLLNYVRGLQIVSFANGPQAPQLVGRVNPTGSYSDTLYSDLERGRLFVLENLYQAGKTTSRIVVYDVIDEKQPFIAQKIELDGRVVDSRIVGDVLYVATLETISGGSRGLIGGSQKNVGKVESFNIAGEVRHVETFKLGLPITRGELMNIQQEGSGSQTKYYLVAVQSRDDWWWWDRQSAVEVVDITNPEGRIRPLMTAYAKGRISERSQTRIKEGHLIVTSNYLVGTATGTARIGRVAVESFRMAGNDASVLTEEEAEYRRLHIERALSKVQNELEREALREKMLTDKDLGLRGRFIRLPNGSLKKLVADATVTSGDSTGLSATLQDVRYDGDLMYVFWVPSNLVDPLDVFNIGDLEKGIQYEGRVLFEGWISRSFPLSFRDKKFIVALGWIVEPINNQNPRRFPQAMIFEVKQVVRQEKNKVTGEIREIKKTVVEKVPGAQVTLKAQGDQGVWADLNVPDREIDLRMDSESRGEILFPVYKWSRSESVQGGQMVRFDLAEAAQGNGESALGVGPFLPASHGWLRRIFTNKEIGLVNAYSTESLSTFDTKGLANSQTANAVSVLELAREIQAYHTLKQDQSVYGLQIVRRGSYQKPLTAIRLVSSENADAEQAAVLSELSVTGQYQDSMSIEDGRALLLMTAKTFWENNKTSTSYTLSRITRVPSGLQLVSEVTSWTEVVDYNQIDYLPYVRPSLTPLKDGRVLVTSSAGQMRLVEESNISAMVSLQSNSCPKSEERRSVALKQVDGRLLYLVTDAKSEKHLRSVVSRYVSFGEIDGRQFTCGSLINIPGEPVLVRGQQMITRDSFARDVRIDSHTDQQENVKVLRTVNAFGFTLVDLNEKTGQAILTDVSEEHVGSRGTLDFQRVAGDSTLYFLRNPEGSRGRDEARLAMMSLENQRLVSSTYALAGTAGPVNLLGIVPSLENSKLAVITNAGQLRVLRFKGNSRPSNILFRPVLENGRKGEPVEVYESVAYGNLHFSSHQRSLEISSGLRGIIQLFL